MKRQLLMAEFLSTPWALMPERLTTVSQVLLRWSAGEAASPEIMAAIAADQAARADKRTAHASAGGGAIAVLPFYGIVTQREINDISGPGSVSTQKFSAAFREALADDSIGAILIDIDSPGGNVYGTGELADEILAARGQKKIVAFADSLAASAAYWIGCAAGEFYCTPGGEVGSIGVWQAHFDYSKSMEDEGVKPTLISAGKFKVEGNPFQPLDAEAQAFLQSRVDDYYTAFARGVSRARNVPIAQVRDGMGQGRCLGADAALAAGMIDGVMTFDQVIKKMQKDLRSAKPVAAATGQRARMAAELQLMNLG